MEKQDKNEKNILLSIQNIGKHFSGREAPVLSEINLEVKEGELVALTGASGSGKTTLLRIIAGLEEAGPGTILFRDKKVVGPADKLIAGHDAIRLVHQHFELAHRRTVFENIAQKLRHLHHTYQEAQTLELMEVCRLGHLAGTYVEELSGGEKQRLAIARALAEEPEVLLLDEPFSNLDPHLKEAIRYDLFSYIREKGLTVLMVSHDPKDALSLADTIWILREGKVVQKASPKEVYYAAVSPEVAPLFGRINICPVKVLLPHLKGEARQELEKAPPLSILGIRPGLLQPVAEEEAHLAVKLRELFFHGAESEAKVEIGAGLIFYLQLPALFVVPESGIIHLKINLSHLSIWEIIE